MFSSEISHILFWLITQSVLIIIFLQSFNFVYLCVCARACERACVCVSFCVCEFALIIYFEHCRVGTVDGSLQAVTHEGDIDVHLAQHTRVNLVTSQGNIFNELPMNS